MFAIAAKEAQRLERLTTDFLVYARPRPVQVARVSLADTLNYVATVARAHAANEGVTIDVAVDSSLEGEFDANQMHQALLNLVLNAIDACHRGDLVKLNAQTNGNGSDQNRRGRSGRTDPCRNCGAHFRAAVHHQAGR